MPCGLVNVGGASCFLNALLQCLFLCPFPLLQGTDEDKPAAECLPREVTPDEYFVVFAKLSDSDVVTAKKNRLLVRRVVTDALLNISLFACTTLRSDL